MHKRDELAFDGGRKTVRRGANGCGRLSVHVEGAGTVAARSVIAFSNNLKS